MNMGLDRHWPDSTLTHNHTHQTTLFQEGQMTLVSLDSSWQGLCQARHTPSMDLISVSLAVDRMISSNTGTLPPTKPVLPPCMTLIVSN